MTILNCILFILILNQCEINGQRHRSEYSRPVRLKVEIGTIGFDYVTLKIHNFINTYHKISSINIEKKTNHYYVWQNYQTIQPNDINLETRDNALYFDVKNLMPNTTYKFRVNFQSQTPEVSATTKAYPQLLKSPTVSRRGYTNITLEIDITSLNGNVLPTHYGIQYKIYDSQINHFNWYQSTLTPYQNIENWNPILYTITNLQPGTSYKFRIIFIFNKKPYTDVNEINAATDYLKLKNNPLIGTDSITFQTDDSESLEQCYFQIIYRTFTYKTSQLPWNKSTRFKLYRPNEEFKISNLAPNTEYEFLFIVNINGHEYSDKPFSHVTKCKADANVNIIPRSRQATFILNLTRENCDNDNYYIQFNSTSYYFNNRNNYKVTIYYLHPNTEYSFLLKHYYEKYFEKEFKFKTLAGTKPVRSIQVAPNSCDSVKVTWIAPHFNGHLKTYNVLLQDYIEKINITNQNTSDTEIILYNTNHNTEYVVIICAVTDEYGEKNELRFNTNFNVSVNNDELPNIDLNALTITENKITIILPECSKVRGALKYYFKITCNSEWCNGEMRYVNISYNERTTNAVIDKLTPYTNYTLSYSYERNSTVISPNINTQLMTKSAYPPGISNYTVYRLGGNEIFIQWKAPYPPHGILEKMYLKHNRNYVVFSTPNCQLWDDTEQYCYILSENLNVYIHIYTKNTNVSYNTSTYIRQNIQNNGLRPQSPINLEYKIKDDDLYIQWKYLHATNQPIQSFQLIIQDINVAPKYKIQKYVTTQEELNDYNYKLSGLQQSSSYKIYVAAVTDRIGESASIQIDTLPPKFHFIDDIQLHIKTEESSKHKIIIPKLDTSQPNNTSFLVIVIEELKNESDTNANYFTNEKCNSLIKNQSALPDNLWISDVVNVPSGETEFILGTNNVSNYLNITHVHNKTLKENVDYKITLLLYNKYKDQYSCGSISSSISSSMKSESEMLTKNPNLLLLLLLLLLLIPVIGYFISRKYFSKKSKKDLERSPTPIHYTAIDDLELSHQNPVVPTISHPKDLENKMDDNPCLVQEGDYQNIIEVKPIILPKKEKTQSIVDKNSIIVQEKPETKIEEKLFVVVKPDISLKIKRMTQPLRQDRHISQPEDSKYSKLIKICDLENYVKESLFNEEIEKQHALFTRNLTKKHDHGLLENNRIKNRYKNLIPYDHTRVKLEIINNDPFSDYINANYINGYHQSNAYIATQGPKANTVYDFWRMIWQEQVRYIVILANVYENDKKKCEQYWPNVNESVTYHDINIKFIHNDLYADFDCRLFEITRNNEARNIYQYHYVSWPDHGVPLYPQSLVTFLRMVLKIPLDKSPLVVHCSAGVGRTGTIILCDICLRMAAAEGAVDCLRYLHEMRNHRACLVDNSDQYKLVHLVLLECLISPVTAIPCNKFKESFQESIDKKKLQNHLEYLNQIDWQNKVFDRKIVNRFYEENLEKNRFPHILPENEQIIIPYYPNEDVYSNYINAVPVSGYKYLDQFIVTQIPLPNTLEDFWRMVVVKNCHIIVSLNNIPYNDQTCCKFWPREKQTIKLNCGIKLSFKSSEQFQYHQLITLELQSKSVKNKIQIIQFHNWNHDKNLPESTESFVTLCDEIENLARGKYPIVITCFDGATASGLLVAYSFITEKIKMEQECDIDLAIRVTRKNRKQFICNEEQLKFLYNSTLKYLEIYETYSNF